MTRLCIADLAEARGLNITELARRADLSYSTTHALWHDKAAQFDRYSLIRLALALEVRVSDLFDGAPEANELPPRRESPMRPRRQKEHVNAR